MFTWFLLEKRHIFKMVKRCVVQFCSNSNKTGYTTLYYTKFEAAVDKICSSKESKFRRADGAFAYLQHSFFSGLLRRKFHGGNGADEAKSATFWCCTDDTVSSSNKIGCGKGASDLVYSTRWQCN